MQTHPQRVNLISYFSSPPVPISSRETVSPLPLRFYTGRISAFMNSSPNRAVEYQNFRPHRSNFHQIFGLISVLDLESVNLSGEACLRISGLRYNGQRLEWSSSQRCCLHCVYKAFLQVKHKFELVSP
ncbi:hypothetical protein AVEN_141374-1 [Araneus ventricosus]|uniref:Uncharacterized protein n=1 Tax=Araneus ventricosus TaxID=182803 RepID=A0A4Y2D0F1_ARAVE|nr:hypothetical protein AVEN_141374-1 [Araneus ventricosus]